jgi:hypothetical protein
MSWMRWVGGLAGRRPAAAKGVMMRPIKGDQRGAVTVEAAFASLGLVALLAVLVGAIGVVLVQVQCVDSAAAIARQAARGDASGVAEANSHVPQGGQVAVRTTATTVTVRVEAEAAIVPGIRITAHLAAESTAVLEPGASP